MFQNSTANALDINCVFVATDILEIDDSYYNTFDYIFITTGAITWFEDLNEFFKVVSSCLKKDGCLIISEMHPITGMLPIEGDYNYDNTSQNKLIHSYFKQEAWIETSGMSYMSDSSKEYKKTFYSFSHTFADIFNGIIESRMQIKKLKEFDEDFSGLFCNLNNMGIPLSYILIAQK